MTPSSSVPRVVTARLELRRPTRDDLPDLTRLWSDKEVTRFLPGQQPIPADRVAPALDGFLRHWDEHAFGVWSLIHRESGQWIGYCGLRHLAEIEEVELLYALDPAWWKQGLTSEAASAAVRDGFERVGLRRIVAIALPQNMGSIGVMKRVGFQFEREARLFGLDTVCYGLERTDRMASRSEAGEAT